MSDFLKSLQIDTWFKVFVYLGGLLLLISLFYPAQWISNKQLILLSGGIFMIGVGEWKNTKVKSWIKEANAYTGGPALMNAKIRLPDNLGRFFNGIGILLIMLAFFDFLGLFIL